MIERTKWIERKFNFDYPPGMFPYFVERLKGTPVRVENIIHGIAEEKLRTRMNNAWSVKEHIGHIIDLEELHETRLNQLLASVSVMLPADMTNKKTNLAEHNSTDTKQLINNLYITRKRFTDRLEKLEDYDITRTALHPRLNKEMRVVDLVYFVAEHDDHHITAIREISKEI